MDEEVGDWSDKEWDELNEKVNENNGDGPAEPDYSWMHEKWNEHDKDEIGYEYDEIWGYGNDEELEKIAQRYEFDN